MSQPDFSMGYLMHWAARLFRRLADQRLKALGLSSGHLPVINALIEQDGMSQKELTHVASIEQPTMAATLARMERDRLIARRPDPRDKRGALYSLTPATKKKVAAIKLVIEGMNKDALQVLPEDQRQQFREQLRSMILSIEKLIIEGALVRSSVRSASSAPKKIRRRRVS